MRKPREYLVWARGRDGAYGWRPSPPEAPSLYAYLAGRTKPPRGFRKCEAPKVAVAALTAPSRRVLHVVGEAVTGTHADRTVTAARFECGASAVHIQEPGDDEVRWCSRCRAVAEETFSVYCFWADDGSALYAGQTSNWAYRLRQHQSRSEWYPLVAWYAVLATYDNRRDALDHELRLIRREMPAFNVQGNPAAKKGAAA